MCSPTAINSPPKEAFSDLRARYTALAMVLGVEEPHGLCTEWSHDQPREEELGGGHPAMDIVNQDETRPAQMERRTCDDDGAMPQENKRVKKWGQDASRQCCNDGGNAGGQGGIGGLIMEMLMGRRKEGKE